MNKTIKKMTLSEIESVLNCKIEIIPERPKKKLADVLVGETFKIGPFEFIVLEHAENGVRVLSRYFWRWTEFDSKTNNYEKSMVRADLNHNFYKQMSEYVKEEDIIKHVVDLTCINGEKDYGECEDYVSLLTFDLYRKYAPIIEKYNLGEHHWWCLATGDMPSGLISLVSDVLQFDSRRAANGIRPYCILSASTIVEELN
jgi:hypothetical protein